MACADCKPAATGSCSVGRWRPEELQGPAASHRWIQATKIRRVLDSTLLCDAVATQDTVTMISSQVRRVRKLVPAAAAAELVRDYDGRAKTSCDRGPPRAGVADRRSGHRRLCGARRAQRCRPQRRAGKRGGAANDGRGPTHRTRPESAGPCAHSAPRRCGPGDLHSGPRGPPRPQDPLCAPRRLPGPHSRRARHRHHHRGRAHHRRHRHRRPQHQQPVSPVEAWQLRHQASRPTSMDTAPRYPSDTNPRCTTATVMQATQ